ncbi:MAG: HupE/UreJ family protein [Solirubrobacteraceae bacterium MAG38_C4-C5]|nr:HupE/UreJ family protein [Candidatus Siliceabacter maunaloa]
MVAHVVRLEVADYLELGIEHILGGPDHILFVLSLLLAFQSIRKVLHLTLTFTAAHSVTLLLAGSGVLLVTSRIVEPVIAFSIAFMALTAVFAPQGRLLVRARTKVGIVFFFGLFHGLGFANALEQSELEHNLVLSLLLFNVGVELGLAGILAVVVPLILVVRRTDWYESAVQVSALTIGAVGVAWGLQRIGLG